jgi:uncharacterized protein YebE (UPF0316 family)
MHTFRPLLIGGLVVTEVAIWQWRMVIAHRGRRIVAMLLGVIGAALQITAITQVVAGVHDVLSVAAYAGGVGCGVLFGLVAGDRLTPGRLEVTIISAIPGLDEALWRSGWSATAHQGQSRHGPVTTVHIDIDRGEEPRLRQDTSSIDPMARWVTKEIRSDTSNRTSATTFAWSRRLWTTRARSRVHVMNVEVEPL